MVGEKEKPIPKDERRKDLKVICHSGLNNFCNVIIPLPKSQTCHPARTQAPLHLPHILFWHNEMLQTPPPVQFFFALKRSPNLHTKTACRELIKEARFGDNNWEKGEDFVKGFNIKKLVWEMEGSLSMHALDDVYNGTIMLWKANWNKTLQMSLKFSDCCESTVPDRSNLTGNALLERIWNAKWNAAGTPKFLWSWSAFPTRTCSIENAITRSIENAITRSTENLWLA